MTKADFFIRKHLAAALLLASLSFLAQPATMVSAKPKASAFPFFEQVIDGLDGDKKALSNWRGKVIIANFWASWCGPCQYEIPRFVNWSHKYKDKGLQVVGIGLDTPRKLKNVARSLGIDYPLLVMSLDAGRPILHRLGNDKMMIPFTIVIDKDGTIASRHAGIMGEDEFEIMVAPLL